MKVSLISLSTMAPFFFIKTRLRPSAKAAGEWRTCRKVSRPQKNKSECFVKAERTATMLSSLF
ncbi:MAG: hypothetical protein GDA51_08415 [Ekhidna sp.]|nr:hypothetical protein [Ekhidna sp.]